MRMNSVKCGVKCFVAMIACFLIAGMPCLGFGAKAIPVGTVIPDFAMELPDAGEARKYLEVKTEKPFHLSEIPAKLKLVEFYSVYCPVCQRQAPKTNKIYNYIQDDPVLKKDIKVIGVGLTNTAKEIEVYRKTFRVKFPLIADAEKKIAEKTGIKDIPMTVLIDKDGKVLASHLGLIKKVDAFMKELKEHHKKQN